MVTPTQTNHSESKRGTLKRRGSKSKRKKSGKKGKKNTENDDINGSSEEEGSLGSYLENDHDTTSKDDDNMSGCNSEDQNENHDMDEKTEEDEKNTANNLGDKSGNGPGGP